MAEKRDLSEETRWCEVIATSKQRGRLMGQGATPRLIFSKNMCDLRMDVVEIWNKWNIGA